MDNKPKATTAAFLPGIAAAATLVGLACQPAHAQTAACVSDKGRRAAMQDFVHLLFDERDPRAAYERYAAPDMSQANPMFGTTRATTIAAAEKVLKAPGSVYKVKDVLVDGDLSAVYYHGVMMPGRPGADVVEFFRWQGPKIVSTWDVLQLEGPPPGSPMGPGTP